MSNTAQQKIRKIPMRKCMGCMQSFPKMELIRVVRAPDEVISLDFKGKKSGRGAYVCKNISCLKKARKSGRIEKNLECSISEEIYDQLETEILADE